MAVSETGPVTTTRRAAMLGAVAFCSLTGARASATPSAPALALEEIGPGVFQRRGIDGEAAPANRDAIANIGFIIGRESVLVTDSGGSLADGRWLLGEIRARTDRPVRHVVISHVHPDHAFGAAAFADLAPDFVGHAGLAAALEMRGEYYRARLVEAIGPEAPESGGERVVLPTRPVGPSGATIDLGDRRLELQAHPRAHSGTDLSMHDREARLLFPADLLFVGRVPSLDGSLRGWLGVLDQLEALGARTAVPGHGPVAVAPGPAIADLRRYLTVLRDDVRAAIAAGRSIPETVGTAGASERGRWLLFDEYHGRNVTQAYKELEWE
jgi:quinoprotein relay system zinc metallohydrolase 2